MIIWTEPALSDLDATRDYIKRDSLIYANRFVEKVFEGVENLIKFPKIGRIVPETADENISKSSLERGRLFLFFKL